MNDRSVNASDSELRRWADCVPSMLAYWDATLSCRYANRAYETWFGVDPSQLLGTSLRDLLGPALFELNRPYIEGALLGQAQSFERVVPGPGGVMRHSMANYLPDVVNGVVQGFIATVTEVTPLKRAEARLHQVIETLKVEVREQRRLASSLLDAETHLAVTLASIEAGFIATDHEGCITRMNPVSERLTGWTEAQALGKSLWEVFVREDRPATSTAMNPVDLVASQGHTVDTAFRVVVISRQGVRTPIESKVALTRDADGEACGLTLVLRDVSHSERAEIDANRLAAIVDSSQDAIIGKTLDGRITNWNPAACALFGYKVGEALGQPIQMLIPPDRQAEEMRILANLARGERVLPFDTLRRAKDGRLIEVSITISPIRDGAGRIVGASKIVRDLTQHRHAERAQRQAERLEAENRQIQEATRLKSQFLANMSHELRTPLNAIIGFAELLHTGRLPPEAPKHHEFLGHIVSSGRHLLQLINDVLDLAKVESGKVEFFPQPVQPVQLVKEVTDMVHTGLLRKHLRLTAEIDSALGVLLLDPARLKQVLYNFLSNAIKFTPDGGRISLRLLAQGEQDFRIEVEDDGIGIEASLLPRLFTEFQQLDVGYAKSHQGTGLGLALTRRLVEAQGGTVGVASRPGQGSVFHAVLRRVHDGRPAPHAAEAKTGADAASRGRVLVIEDEPQALQLLVQALADSGFRVSPARTGSQAGQLALAIDFDALTLKLDLPDQPGLAALEALRSGPAQSTAPVIGMSMPAGSGGSASFAVTDVLCKPLRSEELAAAVAKLGGPPPLSGAAPVMVIDDDPLALELMRTALEALGVTAVCLLDGRQALQEIEVHRPRAIVLDLMMPEFDGFAVLDALHRLPVWRETPVFIWTSMILTEGEYERLALSAQAILSKGGGDLAVMLERLRHWRPQARPSVQGA